MGDELSLKNLEDAIRRYYRQTHAGHSNKKSDNSGDGKEIALSEFHSKCYNVNIMPTIAQERKTRTKIMIRTMENTKERCMANVIIVVNQDIMLRTVGRKKTTRANIQCILSLQVKKAIQLLMEEEKWKFFSAVWKQNRSMKNTTVRW